MGPRTVGVLGVLAAVLTGYVYLFERDRRSPWEGIGPVFPRLELADIEEIEIRPGIFLREGGAPEEPVLLKKRNEGDRSGWWIERPPVPAFVPRVESIAYGLLELQAIAEAPPSDAARAFDPRGPELALRFRARGGEEHLVEVGRDHPDPAFELCYARTDGKRLFLTRRSVRAGLNSRLDDLRSRALFALPKERAARLEVLGDERFAKVARREGEGDDWRFEKPETAPADRAALAQTLDELNAWRAESFVRDAPGDLAPFGLDKPQATIALTDQKGKRIALDVGSPAPEKGRVYVRWSDQPYIMTAAAAPFEGLERPAEHLYSQFVLQLGAEEVTGVEVERIPRAAAEEFRLRRPASAAPARKPSPAKAAPPAAKKEGWTVEAGGASFEGDQDRIGALVDLLSHLRVKRYLPAPAGARPAGTGLGEARFKVEIQTDTGARRSLIVERPLSAEEEEKKLCYAVVEGESFFFQVSTPILEELSGGGGRFRNSSISGVDAEALLEFEVSEVLPSGERRTWTVGRPAESWQLWLGEGSRLKKDRTLDERRARDAARAVTREQFRVSRWASGETDLAGREIADDRFRLRITLTKVEGAQSGFTRLYLGAATENGEYTWARVNTPELKDLPFLLERSAVKPLRELADHLGQITEAIER